MMMYGRVSGVGVFPHVYTPFMGDSLGVEEGGSEGVGESEGSFLSRVQERSLLMTTDLDVGVGGGEGEGGGTFLSPVQEGHLLMTTDLDLYLTESGTGPSVHHLENHLEQQHHPVRK